MGVRQIILPFSTDQFANAADLERSGLASVVSPNHICTTTLAKLITHTLISPQPQPVMPLSGRHLALSLNSQEG